MSGKEGSFMEAMTGHAAGKGKFGWKGIKHQFGTMLGGEADSVEEAVDPSTIDLTESLEGSGLSRGQYDKMVESAQAGYTEPEDFWDIEEPIGQSYEVPSGMLEEGEGFFAEGGQVMDQNTLIGLAILEQMQNGEKAYDNTPLEEAKQPSISEMFASQGKTLGGNNTQSLSQMLGR